MGPRLLSVIGILIALVGAAMLVAPAPARRWSRLLFGVRLPEGRLERISAWILMVIGIAIALLFRVLR